MYLTTTQGEREGGEGRGGHRSVLAAYRSFCVT